MNSYSFSEQAVQDLDDICDHITQQNSAAASKIFDAIRNKCRQVAQFPNMGKPYDRLSKNLRGFSVDNYIIPDLTASTSPVSSAATVIWKTYSD